MFKKIKSWIVNHIKYHSSIKGTVTGQEAVELYDQEVRLHMETKENLKTIQHSYDESQKELETFKTGDNTPLKDWHNELSKLPKVKSKKKKLK